MAEKRLRVSPKTEFKKGVHYSPSTEFKKGMTPYIKLHPEIAVRGEKHPFYGKHHTVKTRNKISKSLTGKYVGEKGTRWRGGKAKCVDCNKLLSSYNWKRCKNCDNKYRIGKHIGPNAPYWLGGISKEPYDFKFDSALRNQIRQRDGHKCQLCGAPETEFKKALCVHHIDYNKKNSVVSNLISLCKYCHTKTNTNRPYWIELFANKIKENNLCL